MFLMLYVLFMKQADLHNNPPKGSILLAGLRYLTAKSLLSPNAMMRTSADATPYLGFLTLLLLPLAKWKDAPKLGGLSLMMMEITSLAIVVFAANTGAVYNPPGLVAQHMHIL